MKTAAPGARNLHIGHFAFMRAVVQGIDLRASWDRYLAIEGESDDLRLVRSTIAWIREVFAAAARREKRPGVARLVLLDVSRLGEPAPVLPSLEEFAAARGIEDFSQAEQLEAYEEAFGTATARVTRRTRLIAKQLEALAWLEELVAQPPRSGDAVASWFHPALAGYLEAAGVVTLQALLERINGVGRLWAGSIKAIGPVKACRIEAWLRDHQATLGLKIGAHVGQRRTDLFAHELAAIVPVATAVRPLEKFQVPAELNGSAGLYRRPQAQCLLKATNDYEALLAWLRSKRSLSPEAKKQLKTRRRSRASSIDELRAGPLAWLAELSHTQRAYRKEGERFLLWAILERGKALSSMTMEDCLAYRDFLADPQPVDQWCASRSRERWSPLWRPFEGPLSARAQQHAITILKNLYSFLVDQNYLMGNPWSGVTMARSAAPRIDAGRSLTAKQWAFVESQLQMLTNTSANHRLRFGLHLLYATGMRLSEVVGVRVGDLKWVSYPPEKGEDEPLEGWLLRVLGKGDRVREVPVPIDVVSELADYLVSRELDPDPEHPANADAFLLAKSVDAGQRAPQLAARLAKIPGLGDGIAQSTLYDQLKEFFVECSEVLAQHGEVAGAKRLAAASTHWLRHTHASHAIAHGMPLEIAQQNLGHASLGTTTVYVTTEQKKRLRAVEGFWAKR